MRLEGGKFHARAVGNKTEFRWGGGGDFPERGWGGGRVFDGN